MAGDLIALDGWTRRAEIDAYAHWRGVSLSDAVRELVNGGLNALPVDTAFELWMAAVDQLLHARLGITHADLADCCYRDAFDDGVTPEEMADEALARDDMGWDGLEWLS